MTSLAPVDGRAPDVRPGGGVEAVPDPAPMVFTTGTALARATAAGETTTRNKAERAATSRSISITTSYLASVGLASKGRASERDPRWRDRAACAGSSTDAFFPVDSDAEGQAVAKSVCGRCPVREECLAFAVASGETYGIWGGTTASGRSGRRRPPPAVKTESQARERQEEARFRTQERAVLHQRKVLDRQQKERNRQMDTERRLYAEYLARKAEAAS